MAVNVKKNYLNVCFAQEAYDNFKKDEENYWENSPNSPEALWDYLIKLNEHSE